MKKFVLLIFLFIIALIFHLSMGTVTISPDAVVFALFNIGDPADHVIIYQFRLPRALVGIISGSGLATAGMILQVLVRNPLASPDVIGITKGASLFAVTVLLVFPSAPFFFIPLSAMIGAMATMLLLFLLTTRMHMSGQLLL